MAAVSGVNPNLANSGTTPRRHSMLDTALELRDYGATAASADTNGTAINYYAEAEIEYEIVIRHAAIGGTVDGSNLWTVRIEADNESGFTSPATLFSQVLTAAATEYRIPMSGERVRQLRLAASMTTPITYLRIVLDETGTTAGDLTVGAWIETLE